MVGLLSPAFLVASVLVIVTPGPDLALVTRTVVAHGRGPAVLAASGMILGGAAHVAFGLAGLGALLSESPHWRVGIQIGGAAILVAYGATGLVSGLKHDRLKSATTTPADHSERRAPEVRRAGWSHAALGFSTNVTNVKVALFLWAFLTPFVPPGVSLAAGTMVLATAHLSLAFCWLMIWTFASSAVLSRRSAGIVSRIDLASSSVIVVLGLSLLVRTVGQA